MKRERQYKGYVMRLVIILIIKFCSEIGSLRGNVTVSLAEVNQFPKPIKQECETEL
jgi:hypothetical protein